MNQSSNLVDSVGKFVGKYGVWVILGLMALEIGLARKRGEL